MMQSRLPKHPQKTVRLQEKRPRPPRKTRAQPTFWPPSPTEVEVQRADGARLRLTYGDANPALVPLVQTFLESR